MTARRFISSPQLFALVLALCVGVYQTAHSVHDILHWHPEQHAEVLPSFSERLAPQAETEHETWAESLLCTVCAAGVTTKAALIPPQFAGPPRSTAGMSHYTDLPIRVRWSSARLPPSRAPPLLS